MLKTSMGLYTEDVLFEEEPILTYDALTTALSSVG